MGIIKNIIENVKEADQRREDIDDDRTKDRYLRSLRRQRRTQLEEMEKKILVKKIKEYEFERARLMSNPEKDRMEQKIAIKKGIIRQKQFMIPKRRPKDDFLSRGNL